MRRFLSWTTSASVARLELGVLLRMLYRFDRRGMPTALNREDLAYIKYFTVLSNMLLGLAAAIYCVALLLTLCRVARRVPGWAVRLKYTAVTLTTLTFLVVVAYIGPRTGFRTAYAGPNLWLHLILPLLAAIDWLALDREGGPGPRSARPPVLCVAAYGAFYLGNLLLNGWGGRTHPNDWYGFADGGPAGAYVAFAALLAAAGVLAWALRLGHGEGR